MNIYENDLLWTSEFTNWRKAKEFPELLSIVLKTPPPVPIEKERTYIINLYKKTLIFPVLFGLIFGSLSYFILQPKIPLHYNGNNSTYYSYTENTFSQKMSRSFRAIGSLFNDESMFAIEDELLFLNLVGYSIFDFLLFHVLLFCLSYFFPIQFEKFNLTLGFLHSKFTEAIEF